MPLGPTLESFYGHQRFLMLYIVGALGGNVLSFLMTRGLSVGASTAIFALVAAEGVFIYQNRTIFGSQARAMLSNVVFIVIINLGLGFLPGIDNFGHLGGLIAGLAFGWFAGPRFEVEPDFTGRYKLVDKSNPATAWLVAIVLAIIFLGSGFPPHPSGLMEELIGILRDNPLLLLFVVAAIGYPLGRIKIGGTSLGVAAVLFVGLAFGALDPELKLPEIIYQVGTGSVCLYHRVGQRRRFLRLLWKKRSALQWPRIGRPVIGHAAHRPGALSFQAQPRIHRGDVCRQPDQHPGSGRGD